MSLPSISTSSLSDTDSFPSTPTTPTTQYPLPTITITIINPTPHSLQAIKNNKAWIHLQDPIRPNSDGKLILHHPTTNTGKAAYILGDTGDVIEVAGGIGIGMVGDRYPLQVKLCPEFGGGENEVLEGVMMEPGHFVYRLPELEHEIEDMNILHHHHHTGVSEVVDAGGNAELGVSHFNPCF
ncbi:hypothetical protein TWF506_003189 [Arthrobotrys conoides]|uniref:Uncharacterized protein n=1 Tax=Arthrobotrys conoides TaxID=74498 RepID=A0AAN8NE91_9PEZI